MILPSSASDIQDVLHLYSSVSVGSEHSCRLPIEAEAQIGYKGFNRIVDLQLSDQLVIVESGVLLSTLNQELNIHGFEVPYHRDVELTLGDHLALNLPHIGESSWRDWVTRTEMVLADGTQVVSGANVVKSVSGFDLHKLMIGARGTLGIVTQLTLRIRPIQPFSGENRSDFPDVGSITPTVRKLMIRTKDIFDPARKLNPGEFGFI
jgi:FAD/FMN-containing dehydrogenase